MESNHQDRERCIAAERGGREAAERLLEDHYQAVYAYHRRQVPSDADAVTGRPAMWSATRRP